jgi:hypothetical protein
LNAAALPYQKNVLEALAAVVVGTIVNASQLDMRDAGHGVQVHDFDVVDQAGLTRPFEVTTALDQAQIQSLAATQQFQDQLSALTGDWTLHVQLSPDARITQIANGLPALLADLRAAGTHSFYTESRDPASIALGQRFAALGITNAQGLYSPGAGGVLMGQPAIHYAGPDAVTAAAEGAAHKADNLAKLRAVGGGELFVWIDASHPGNLAFLDPSGCASAPAPDLPAEIRAVWAGQLFSWTDNTGVMTAFCGGLWRAAKGACWEDLSADVPERSLVFTPHTPGQAGAS